MKGYRVNPNGAGAFIASFSGGKDSCLACYQAMLTGLKLSALCHMIIPRPGRSLKEKMIRAQADAMRIPVFIQETSRENYEKDFQNVLRKLSTPSVKICVFGDIDLEAHKKWNENVCRLVSLKPLLPLWKKPRRQLINEFLEAGFRAVIVTVNTRYLSRDFLGREINIDQISEFERLGIDICGENGEYHTVVTQGPIFNKPLQIRPKDIFQNGDYAYLDFDIRVHPAA